MKQKIKSYVKKTFFDISRRCVGKVSSAHRIKSYECTSDGELKLLVLMHLLQEISEKHINILGFGVDFCRKQGFAWVATKYIVHITKHPLRNERIKISSWISENSLSSVTKDAVVCNAKGDILVSVSSQWSLISFSSRRPLLVEKTLPKFRIIGKRLFAEGFKKIRLPEIMDVSYIIHVTRDHIDFNKHVNNAYYVSWAAEAVEDKRALAKPLDIRIEFKRETLYGENLVVESKLDGTKTTHAIKSEDGQCKASVIINWS